MLHCPIYSLVTSEKHLYCIQVLVFFGNIQKDTEAILLKIDEILLKNVSLHVITVYSFPGAEMGTVKVMDSNDLQPGKYKSGLGFRRHVHAKVLALTKNIAGDIYMYVCIQTYKCYIYIYIK